MKVFGINSADNNVNFKRKPSFQEMQVYTSSLNKGLKLLNKQIDVIIHNSSAPAVPGENTGIGSLFSRTTQEKLIPFLKAHGVTGIQQEPNNLRKTGDPSPYAPESSAKNIFMIPLEKLASSKYGFILPEADFKNIVSKVKQDEYVDYNFVNQEFDNALRIAYANFKKSDLLKPEFEEFKKNNTKTEQNAIYRILNNLHKKYWEQWSGIDRNLYSPRNAKQAKEANARIEELRTKYADEIDYFTFQQFLIDLENKESNELVSKTGVKIIGDSPVASPAADEWINQDLFLKGKAIGCPPDYFSKSGQRWGFKYFDPQYIFNPDGTLGKAGKILKEKYDSFFASFPGGLRIDHLIGLIDPFIYTVKDNKMTTANSGRIYSLFTGKYQKKDSEFSNILEKIVLQSAKDHGMNKDELICEDLGDKTVPTKKVMKKLGLSGISLTQFGDRGAKAAEGNTIMIGSHDNASVIEYTDELFAKPERRKELLKKTDLLAKDTAPMGAEKEKIKEYKNELRTDKKKFIEANFAELFTSPAKRIQIFFSDFWGIGKTYNTPGTKEGNWILRVGSDFENNYYKAVAEGKAPNLAKAVATALRQRGLDKTNPELINDLDNSAKILSSK